MFDFELNWIDLTWIELNWMLLMWMHKNIIIACVSYNPAHYILSSSPSSLVPSSKTATSSENKVFQKENKIPIS